MPDLSAITGNLAMPGFTAPKLQWVREHEPETFAKTRRVLLPKDWLRLMLTGEAVSEMSDAASTSTICTRSRKLLSRAPPLEGRKAYTSSPPRALTLMMVGSGLRSEGVPPSCTVK